MFNRFDSIHERDAHRASRTDTARRRYMHSIARHLALTSVTRVIMFLLYTADLLQLVKRHHLTPHAYADETQIYGYCQPSDAGSLIQQVSVCTDEVSAWMKGNRLQLNPAKTEVLWCASSRRQHQILFVSVMPWCRQSLQPGTLVSTSTPASP